MSPAAAGIPALTTLITAVLAILGVNDAGIGAQVKTAIVAAAGLVVAVTNVVHAVQHYRTQRHADELAANLKAHELEHRPSPTS